MANYDYCLFVIFILVNSTHKPKRRWSSCLLNEVTHDLITQQPVSPSLGRLTYGRAASLCTLQLLQFCSNVSEIHKNFIEPTRLWMAISLLVLLEHSFSFWPVHPGTFCSFLSVYLRFPCSSRPF